MPPGHMSGFVWVGIYIKVTSAMVKSQSSSGSVQALVFAPRQELAKSTL